MRLPEEIINFFLRQNYTIVTSIDKNGLPHNSCKGIIKIDRKGIVYLLDLYKKRTYANLKNNSAISIAAVDELGFKGYSLKGKARIVLRERITPAILKAWEQRIAARITQRLIKNIHETKGHPRHPEAQMPKPTYLIAVKVKQVVDLTPRHIKEGV